MEQFCQLISDKNDVWYCTNAELAEYNIKLRECTITEDRIINPTNLDIYASDENRKILVKANSVYNL